MVSPYTPGGGPGLGNLTAARQGDPSTMQHDTPEQQREHRRRNDEVFLVTKRQHPTVWERFLALLSPQERAAVEERAARAEREEGER